MPSLWGSQKNGNGDDHDEHEEQTNGNMARNSQDREPTERDRLLPDSRRSGSSRRRPHSDGYLDPDDPAVSPYNLWTVRFLRYLTILFLALTFLWWVLLLVSIFVSPPGLNSRGSGYFDFSYACLAIGTLLCQLLFFSAPSMAMRVCQGVLALLLLVDLIIIVSVSRLRSEEGPPGIASVVWTTVMAAWCVMLDRVVAWGKREEEERLTGRPETRRTLKEWLSVLAATVILVIYIIIAVFLTATLVLRSRDASLEWDGERYYVDDNKYQIHMACVGNRTDENTPTILLEAAEEPSEYDFEHWAYAAWQNGTIDRYCYWDRPGYGWSDNAPSPHSAGMSADNLAEALAVAGEEGPYVVVSAGYGSIVSRIFSARNFRQVVGIMLVDPMAEDFLPQLGSPTRGLFLWGWGVISPLGIRRNLGAVFSGQTREDRVYGEQARTGGKFLKAQLQENLVAQSLTKSEVSSARTIQTPETPLVVVSSGINFRKDSDWSDGQKKMSKITDNLLSWDVVNKAPHYVWRTYEGRKVMEKRLGQLVKAGKKMWEKSVDEVDVEVE